MSSKEYVLPRTHQKRLKRKRVVFEDPSSLSSPPRASIRLTRSASLAQTTTAATATTTARPKSKRVATTAKPKSKQQAATTTAHPKSKQVDAKQEEKDAITARYLAHFPGAIKILPKHQPIDLFASYGQACRDDFPNFIRLGDMSPGWPHVQPTGLRPDVLWHYPEWEKLRQRQRDAAEAKRGKKRSADEESENSNDSEDDNDDHDER